MERHFSMRARIFLVILLWMKPLHAQDFWEPVLPSVALVVTFAANSEGHLFAASYLAGVYRSTDGGTTWDQVNSGLMFASALGFTVNPQNGDLFVSSGARIYRSTNNGEIWVLQDSTTFPSGAWRLVVNNQGTLFASPNSSDSLRRSSDSGLTWTIAHNGLPYGLIQDLRIRSNGDIYVAMHNDWVFRSSDNGENWTTLIPPFPPFPFLDADAIAFGSGSEIYVGDDGWGFFKSTDEGSSWEQLNSGLPNQFVWALAVSDQGHLFAGLARDGIYRSTNGGAQWDSINTGLDSLSRRIYSLLIASNGHIFAGTAYGLYRSAQPVTHVADDLEGLVPQYVLFQNYPNPFNPTTTIGFNIPAQEFVSLKVFDLLGREVATLVNEELNPGGYKVTWDANTQGLSNGVYFYRLQAGAVRETRKSLLLK